jgi:hypothetical protein
MDADKETLKRVPGLKYDRIAQRGCPKRSKPPFPRLQVAFSIAIGLSKARKEGKNVPKKK